MDKQNEIFNASIQTGFIDKTILSSYEYQPELLVNQKTPPKKVLTTIIHELEKCDKFYISVAFVTTSGVASIINKLKELEDRNVEGKILVSQYLNFTQPEALRRLAQFKNIELRIATTGNAHAKGYIFRNKNHFNLIVGSSNLTAQALSTNKEWNMKVSALEESSLAEKTLNEFNSDFNLATIVTNEYILSYEKIYLSQFLLRDRNDKELFLEKPIPISPNSMQLQALENLQQLRKENKNKALLISATGTGKTYLSAFDAKAFNACKLLFVVHRLTIAKSSLETFRNVFESNKTMGLYSGEKMELECDFIFSTIQTISKTEHLNKFSQEHFDYIIIDETHRSGAESYSRLINYFKPKFLLGMTATPERTDGNDIFKLFDHNIAFEIRLHRAMEENMLSSFHYYGVTDLTIEGNRVDNVTDFNLLISIERVNRIIEQARFYGSDNGITRGLIFCSRKNEAIELSKLLNTKGVKTIALTGDSHESERSQAIEKLESDNLSEKLDYIITVDIFNEGIDIPKINQIIMLRPTESAIIFIQQLGRGLRKVDGKGYLTVIDFIGNYENNYLIPVALYGDTSYNKDTLRKLIAEGSKMIPGSSTINFDEITKEKIFQSIDSANMQLFADLKKDYNLLKYKLGRIPMMMDFITHGSRDPFLYVEHSKSYYNFVFKIEKDSNFQLSEREIKILELFNCEINNSKRVEESLILKMIIESDTLSVKEFKTAILKRYNYNVTDETIKSCVSNLNFEFIREKKNKQLLSVKKIYDLDIIQLEEDSFIFSKSFSEHLKQETFKRYLLDSINYSILEFEKYFLEENWNDGFVLYRKYSRKDVFRILNVSENPVAQNVGGYLVSPNYAHCPVFVNYHKEENISESTKYEDQFVNNREFDWMSKSNRKKTSSDVQAILGAKGKIRLPLFIKKNNDEGLDFYYMGELSPELNSVEQTTMKDNKGKQIPVVKIRFILDNPVITSMYEYLHETVNNNKVHFTNMDEINSKSITKEPNNLIPFYDFYAAAGSFSEIQSNKEASLIEVPEKFYPSADYFACQIIGESMNRVIPNGSICLFKHYMGGSRNGKIVLVENLDKQDQDFNSAFTIKTYSSVKTVSEDTYEHTSIELRPNSYDSSYQSIILNEENSRGMRVIGEFVSILPNPLP
jgi:superfamily II DNA or RNA helicase/HKD family nuclease